MRPVNLIPPEDRRGDRTPLRAGSLSYVLVGALALALAGVTTLVLTGNQISDREAEVVALEAREAEANEVAEALKPYAEFASLEQARTATVSGLARSRFDWERVLRELALVIPSDVWLVGVTGTANPNVQLEGGPSIQARSTVPGPALELTGCGASQESVARFVAALEDIDGVTRVGVAASGRPEEEASSGSAEDCRTRDFIAKFELVAAFDEAPIAPAPGSATPAAPAPSAPQTPVDDAGVAEAQAQEQEARDSTAEQTGEAREATNLIPGVAR